MNDQDTYGSVYREKRMEIMAEPAKQKNYRPAKMIQTTWWDRNKDIVLGLLILGSATGTLWIYVLWLTRR